MCPNNKTYSGSSSNFWKKVASIGSAVLLSSLINSTAIAESPNKYGNVEAASPTLQIDLDSQPLNSVLERLVESFDRGYLKNNGEINEPHPNGKITLGIEQDSSGKHQPVIYLEDKGVLTDKLYFSRIKVVKKAVKNSEKSISNHVLFSYLTIVYNNEGLGGRQLSFYDIKVNNDPDVPASYILALAQRYANEDFSDNTTPLKEFVKKIPVYVSSRQLKAICNNDFSTISEEFGVLSFEKVSYDECVYEPKKSVSGLKKVTDQIIAAVSVLDDKGIVIYCGNADILPAHHCPSPVNEGNTLLSFYRADKLAEFVSDELGDDIKGLTEIPYPNGTLLNERSVRVYYLYKSLIKNNER